MKSSQVEHGVQPSSVGLCIPESPAPRGYLANPFRIVADEAHSLLNEYLSPHSVWEGEFCMRSACMYLPNVH